MTTEAHLDDGTLIAVVDGEEVGEDAADHLGTCLECARRLRALEGRSGRVGALLQADAESIPPPDFDADFRRRMARADRAGRPSSRPSLRWAAAIALIGLVVGVSPARAWLLRVGGALLSPRAVEEAPVATTQEPAATEVLAEVTGPTLEVWTSSGALPDSLVVVRSLGPSASAVLRPSSDGEILVRTGGFEVRAGSPGTILEVHVPPDVTAVRVRIDGDEVALRTVPDGVGPAWAIPLR